MSVSPLPGSPLRVRNRLNYFLWLQKLRKVSLVCWLKKMNKWKLWESVYLWCASQVFLYFFLHSINRTHFYWVSIWETWPQRVLRREAVNASPRVLESSEMVGPWLSRLLLRWPVLTEELQESSPTGGILLLCPQGWLPGWDAGQSPGPLPHPGQMLEVGGLG